MKPLTALRTNQIATFVTVSSWKKVFPLLESGFMNLGTHLGEINRSTARIHSFRLLLDSTNEGQPSIRVLKRDDHMEFKLN